MVEIGVLIMELLSIFAIVEDILGIHIFSVIQHESTISEINDSLYLNEVKRTEKRRSQRELLTKEAISIYNNCRLVQH